MSRFVKRDTIKEHNWFCRQADIEEKYRGEYIAIVGEKIVAHGKHLKEVMQKAKRHSPNPLIYKVPSHEIWLYDRV